jgi:hypothetical protein
MAILPQSPPPARQMAMHADTLEAFLVSPERATAPDVNDVVMSENGTIINLGWLRELTRDVRKVANHLDSQEPKAMAAQPNDPGYSIGRG